MMRSMFSGVSGLRTHQSRMDVIAHNIANVNTVGFKSSRMTFADAFSQTLQGAAAPNVETGRGGTNPMQIGLGVNVSSIQRLMTTGGAQRTDDPFHLMIEGDGFFVVGDNVGGLMFTRAGNFEMDRAWNLHLNGLRLQGWEAPWELGGPQRDADGRAMPIMSGPVDGIQIHHDMRVVRPSATANTAFTGNLRPTDSPIVRSMNFHDSLGQTYSMSMRFTLNATAGPGGTPAWTVERAGHITRTSSRPHEDFDYAPGTVGSWEAIPGLILAFDDGGFPVIDATGPPPTPFVHYLEIQTPPTGGAPGITPDLNLTFGRPHPTQPAAIAEGSIRIDFSGLTAFNRATSAVSEDVDGMEAGELIGLSIGPDGVISGTYSNGQSFSLWQIALASFDNPAGLAAMGGNLFQTTTNSGLFDGVGLPPAGLGTRLLGGTLEMSNVDLASEFTEMITTQRGFQANSRVISTSDEILQELVNLRR